MHAGKVRTAYSAPRSHTTATRASEEEVHEVNEALWRQKRPPPGTRPTALREPGPQVEAATVGYVAAGAPLLVVPSLSAAAADGDAVTLSFLVNAAVRLRAELDRRKKR